MRRTALVSKGDVPDFRPFSLAVAGDGSGLWLVDWAYNGWLANGPRTGRLYRLRLHEANPDVPAPRPTGRRPLRLRLEALDHPALAGPAGIAADPRAQGTGGGSAPGRAAQAGRARDGPAARPLGTRRDRRRRRPAGDRVDAGRPFAAGFASRRRDRRASAATGRCSADLLRLADAIAMRRSGAKRRSPPGRLGDLAAAPALYAALGDADAFAAWSVRQAIRRLDAWDKQALVEALLDERRLESALRLTDEAWAVPVVDALTEALDRTTSPAVRGRIVANLAGLYRRYPEWSGQWFGTNPLAGAVPAEDGRLVARGDERRAGRPGRWLWPTATARSGSRRSSA